MKDKRKQFFFWLGVFVFPLFWSWGTLGKEFTRKDRLIAFLWLIVFAVWLSKKWNIVEGELDTLSITYPAVLAWLTIALLVWLAFRLRFIPTIIEIIILIGISAGFHPTGLIADRIGQPFDWRWAFPPILVALAHLAVHRCKVPINNRNQP